MKKTWHDWAWEDYLYWQKKDKDKLRRINRLLTDIERHGYKCTGKPEALSEDLSGWWSIRIDQKNRIVFKITGKGENQILEIMQCGSHYRKE
jgi:toxin YoeB